MSVIIKSNQVSNINFGSTAMLGATPQAEFDKYKARVVADGGVIKDEARTLAAFELLFDSRTYGNINTFVSGTFGVKTDSAGGITKLYSIDGIDLEGVVYGTGVLPTLDSSNNISFASNGSSAETVSGGMFTTTTPLIMSKSDNFGMGVTLITNGDTAYRYLATLTKHSDVVSGTISTIFASKTISDRAATSFSMQTDPYTVNTTTTSVVAEQQTTPAMSTYLTTPTLSKLTAFRNGVATVESAGKTFSQIKSEPFYLDFGGAFISKRKGFSSAVVKDFICMGNINHKQALRLSRFSA